MKKDSEVKQHIFEVVVGMLESGYETEALTIRKIAMKANVSVGLIHYHFGSKDDLLLLATQKVIDQVAVRENIQLMDMRLPPKERLRKFLYDIATIVVRYETFSKTMLKQELLSDSFSTPSYILSVLKEIKPEATDETIKWLSIMVVAPLQIIFLKEEGFKTYMNAAFTITPAFIDAHLETLGL